MINIAPAPIIFFAEQNYVNIQISQYPNCISMMMQSKYWLMKKYNPRLLSELLFHESLHKFMTDLEIYIDGFNDKGIQIANAFPDVIRYKLN